jgi:predicted RNase H-like HicB family nuclease
MTHRVTDLEPDIEREEDGRWIAEIVDLPGVLAYGSSRTAAIARARRLARSVIAERQTHREPDSFEN